ncbi:ABC transporter permease [Microcoleus sp. FACHB-1515]|uniref:cell division protein FtsX n=1 Tax=Cyanophyceae TaxID=3028117 RepID=UPI00168A31FF|nr:ABC transporter permease [Microcoleus sp. FACHB-1515]MBD2090366.1 ABC transporter permease [Microcoleus sp. FACHB-1515]
MLKFFTKFDYLLRETALGLRRGGWMNWAATSTVTVLLLLFGLSLQASWQLESLLNGFGNQLEISVFLKTGVEAVTLKPAIATLPEVRQVTAISKEEAWKALVADMGITDINGATGQLRGNPLVDELKVKAREADQVPTLAAKLQKVDGVDAVQYVSEAVQRIGQLNIGLSWLSSAITTMLTLTAIAVITTTIRLIVMARRREIEVMQLVGATATWIYLPFILQGVTFGCVGAAIAWGLIRVLQRFLGGVLLDQPEFIQFLVTQSASGRSILLPFILLGLGMSIGMLGSLLAVRKVAIR